MIFWIMSLILSPLTYLPLPKKVQITPLFKGGLELATRVKFAKSDEIHKYETQPFPPSDCVSRQARTTTPAQAWILFESIIATKRRFKILVCSILDFIQTTLITMMRFFHAGKYEISIHEDTNQHNSLCPLLPLPTFA
jgi:hypothetical protein